MNERAHDYFCRGSYQRARDLYEQVYALDSKDFSNLAELTELYMVLGDDMGFDKKYSSLEAIVLEDDEKVMLFYLKATKALLKEDLGSATDIINQSVNYIQKNEKSLVRFTWDFKELTGSDRYKKLQGDSKLILDNFIKYLERKLTPEDRQKFENGNHRLT